MKSRRPLLAANFFAGDVAAGLGPYLAIYLLSAYHWKPGGIGLALAVGSITTVIVQTPAGALIDATTRKRLLLAACAAMIAIAVAVVVISDDPPWMVYAAQISIGVAAAFLGPLIAAITLGLVGPDRFAAQASANQAWNHAGNVFGAGLALILAVAFDSTDGVFWLIIVMGVCMVTSVLMIDDSEIDHDMARGGTREDKPGHHQPSGFRTLLEDRRLLIFAACVVLFHFANAAMLPLVSQKISSGGDSSSGVAFTSACIIAAQLVMIPVALLCGAKADVWGRKVLFLAAFAVLPLRGVLYTVSDNEYFLVGVQAMDGLANGIFGVLFLLILADIMRGTGRFNIAQGAVTTLIGVGASLSNLISEWIVEIAGYDTGFYFLAGIAVLGAALFAFAMPETAEHRLQAKDVAGGS